MTRPLVSIIVPTKNASQFLAGCLDSISHQTYKQTELIVVDNFSTDRTIEVAKQYTDHVYLRGPERSTQRNYGVSQAHGEYVALIDADMELSPRVIEDCLRAIRKDATATGVIIPEESFGEGFWAECKALERSYYVGNSAIEAARFFPRATYEYLGGYDDSLVSGEDWDLSFRANTVGSIGRCKAFIRHNEGHLRFWQSIRKKYYYAKNIRAFISKNLGQASSLDQVNPWRRYVLFFSHPGRLLAKPMVGIGMLILKTGEFSAGFLGYMESH